MALGSGSLTVPSSTIASSLGLGRWSLRDRTAGLAYGIPPRRSGARRANGTDYQTHGLSGHREDLGTVVGDGDGVLPVGGKRPVGRHDAPAVVQHPGARPAHVDHGLHGEDVAGAELDAL